MPKETSKRNRAAIQLTSGRTIRLLAIDQRGTYEGLLLGVPTRSMNQAMMDRLRIRYVRPGEYGVPLLLEPEQRPIDVPSHVQRMDTPAGCRPSPASRASCPTAWRIPTTSGPSSG